MAAPLVTQYQFFAQTSQAIAGFGKLSGAYSTSMATMQATSKMAEIALLGLAAATVAVGAGAMIAMGATSEFNNQLTTLRALSGITKEEMYELSKSVNAVATEFGVSGDEIAAGTVTLAKAGLTVDEINESIRAMTMLAKANGITFDEAATMSVFAVETFGKEFSQIGGILDQMQVATKESILNIEDLQKGFAYAGATSNMLGVDFEQLISVMAVLSNRAMVAGISARSFNKMLIDMFQHVGDVDALIQDLGGNFSIIGDDGVMNLDQLIAALGNTKLTTDLLERGLDVFTVRALRAFGLLAGATDDYAIMLEKVNAASGTLSETAAIQMESWNNQFARMKQSFLEILRTPEMLESLGVMVGHLLILMEGIKPAILEYLVTSMTEFTELITDPGFIDIILGLVGIVGKLAAFFGVVADHVTASDYAMIKLAVGLKIAIPIITNMTYLVQALGGASFTAAQGASLLQGTFFGLYGAAVLYASTTDPTLKALALLTAGFMAVNLAMMTTLALKNALSASSKAGPLAIGVGVGVFAASMAAFYKIQEGFGTKFAESTANMAGLQSAAQANYATMSAASSPVADFGYMAPNTFGSTYDYGSNVAPRHKMVWVEPGEQIISKTQGMVGAGGGVTVNVGDVYAQDGTDFAEKLASALPYALRRASERGAI